MPEAMLKQKAILANLRPLFKFAMMRSLLKRGVKPGPTAEERVRTVTDVWGEVEDHQGRKAAHACTVPKPEPSGLDERPWREREKF